MLIYGPFGSRNILSGSRKNTEDQNFLCKNSKFKNQLYFVFTQPLSFSLIDEKGKTNNNFTRILPSKSTFEETIRHEDQTKIFFLLL